MIMKTVRRPVLLLLVLVNIYILVGCAGGRADYNSYNGIPFSATQKEVMPKIEAMIKKQDKDYDRKVVEDSHYNKKEGFYEIFDTFNDVKIDGFETDLTATFISKDDKNRAEAMFTNIDYEYLDVEQYKAEEIYEYYDKIFTQQHGAPNRYDDSDDSRIKEWCDEHDDAGCSIWLFHHYGSSDVYISWYSNVVEKQKLYE